MTKLRSGLPKDPENNGLPSINKTLNEDPHTTHLVVAVIECAKTEIDHGDGDAANAVVRILRIEPIVDDDDNEAVGQILDRATDERTGRLPLPIDENKDPKS